MKIHPKTLIIACVWLLVVGTGLVWVLNYETGEGSTGETPAVWPKDASISQDSTRPTLVMFVHPQCPCTRASVDELNRLLAHADNPPAAHVIFLKPSGQSADWVESDLWRSAARIPGVMLRKDADGREARRFGAETSGYVVLYDPHGELLFKGGITAGRGHAGDNAGENLILALLSGRDVGSGKQTPVFGCALQEVCERRPVEGYDVRTSSKPGR